MKNADLFTNQVPLEPGNLPTSNNDFDLFFLVGYTS